MKKQTKILFVFATYFCLLLFDSCSNPDDGLNCGGGNQPPFYDFQSLNITPNQNEISIGDQLELTLELSEFSYLAFHRPTFSLGLINKAYGCSPLPPGYDGPKFPIEKIELTSDQNFNNDFPADSSLNELVVLKYFNDIVPLTQADMNQINFEEPENTQKILTIEATPDELNIEHTFTLKITKSNGDIVENSISGIVWK